VILNTILFPISASASDIQEDAANILYALGLFNGTENGFELYRKPTRAEGLAMFIRLIGAEDEALSEEYPHPFSDIPSWADNYVGYAYCNGLAHGVSDNIFGAQQYMTVEAYTTLILRALGYNDSNGDFSWNTSMEKAKEIGMLTSEESADLLNQPATRGSMVLLSLIALSQPLKDDNSVTLVGRLIDKGVFTQSQLVEVLNAAASEADSSASDDKIFYKGIPISTFFNQPAANVAQSLGWTADTDRDDDIRLYTSDGYVESVEISNVSTLALNGTSLEKNRDGLLALLGESYEEGNSSGYFMKYQFPNYSMTLELGEPNSTAWRVFIYPPIDE